MAREGDGKPETEKYVYRISTAKEWDELQSNGFTFGGDLDNSTACFHLSTLLQVQPTLQRFFKDVNEELYLLQIDSNKLGDGLIYEVVEGNQWFPHFYGPSRSFAPLPLDAVTRTEKITLSNGIFTCTLLH
ncbi:hypothetical protein SOVF_060040 [Spinacia oleracea]|uniref:Uncharacterized protein n=1 Tax=Spinacia oleracea TaxID=3562 RepID=A0A9R0HS89_SPIOL|nr:uncharacterized protein LOC110775714 [Spinacia oleracea]KNA19607.1 hypothetical protein SOVF_060040 [Spinacia oleracea]